MKQCVRGDIDPSCIKVANPKTMYVYLAKGPEEDRRSRSFGIGSRSLEVDKSTSHGMKHLHRMGALSIGSCQ